MLGRVWPRMSAGEHGDRAGVQRRAMHDGVDPAREAGNDHIILAGQAARHALCEREARGGGVARPDEGDAVPPRDLCDAAQRQNGRRIGNLAQEGRIVGIAHRRETHAHRLSALDFA